MKTIHLTLQRLALAALAATALMSQAEATPVVSINPASQTIGVGGNAGVDIVVSGLSLTDPTGGFSLTLGFNNALLKGVSFLNDPGTKMGLAPLDLSGGFSGGTLDLFFVADASATLASLAASEGTSFTLAHLTFMGLSQGLSPLTLSKVTLSNWNGDSDLAGVTSVNGQICVAAAVGAACDVNPIPEPETVLLLATGLVALALRRRRAA